MTGKVLCLLLAMGFALIQAYHAPMYRPVRPRDMIHDLLEKVKDLIEEAKTKIPELEQVIQNDGQQVKEPAIEANEGVLSLAEAFINKAGACGQSAQPQMEKAKKDAQAGVDKCISVTATKGSEVIEKVKLLLVIADKLIKEIEAEIEECNSASSPAELTTCLANIATSQEIKVGDLTSQVIPGVFNIYKFIDDVELCISYQTHKLQGHVNKIVDNVEECLGGTK